MRFTVIWQPLAESRLAELWVEGPDRAAITSAANTIDKLLFRDPENQGESRDQNTRVLFVPPLAVRFQVDEPDRKVFVAAIWRYSTTP